jgi:hypothetical protein
MRSQNEIERRRFFVPNDVVITGDEAGSIQAGRRIGAARFPAKSRPGRTRSDDIGSELSAKSGLRSGEAAGSRSTASMRALSMTAGGGNGSNRDSTDRPSPKIAGNRSVPYGLSRSTGRSPRCIARSSSLSLPNGFARDALDLPVAESVQLVAARTQRKLRETNGRAFSHSKTPNFTPSERDGFSRVSSRRSSLVPLAVGCMEGASREPSPVPGQTSGPSWTAPFQTRVRKDHRDASAPPANSSVGERFDGTAERGNGQSILLYSLRRRESLF